MRPDQLRALVQVQRDAHGTAPTFTGETPELELRRFRRQVATLRQEQPFAKNGGVLRENVALRCAVIARNRSWRSRARWRARRSGSAIKRAQFSNARRWNVRSRRSARSSPCTSGTRQTPQSHRECLSIGRRAGTLVCSAFSFCPMSDMTPTTRTLFEPFRGVGAVNPAGERRLQD